MRRLTPAERRRIMSRVWPRARKHWQVWAGAGVALVIAVGVFVPVGRLLTGAGITGLVNGLLAGAAAGLLAGTVLAQFLNRVTVPYLREELRPGMPHEPPAASNPTP